MSCVPVTILGWKANPVADIFNVSLFLAFDANPLLGLSELKNLLLVRLRSRVSRKLRYKV